MRLSFKDYYIEKELSEKQFETNVSNNCISVTELSRIYIQYIKLTEYCQLSF